MTTDSAAAFRVLVVDDNAMNRLMLSRSLQKSGYTTIEAANGSDALRLARESAPDIVLLDVMMDGQDGFDVCRELKARAETASIPVIFVTALAHPSDIESAFAAGGSDFVTKPFQMGEVKARVAVHLQLRRARRELAEAHAQILCAQKLESIGRLAAGIAHEINTPTQYVGDNIRFLQESFAALEPLLAQARALVQAACSGAATGAQANELARTFEEADFDFLSEEIPRAIEQSTDGVQRITKIVRAMKEFSHPGSHESSDVDLNRIVENSVVVATAEWKHFANVELALDPDLPLVVGQANELGQVVLNLVVNAAHAIGDVPGRAAPGTITVATRRDGEHVEMRVSDTGVGIPEAVRDKIFDPFFTTKEVGKGTGQGLAIAHSVVVKQHGGTIAFETAIGAGTTFVVRLPLRRTNAKAA